MNNPLISVIVPVYNVEKYLPRCVDSIWGQTYTNLEIILVDDGSPDSCGRICDEYAAKDNRIKVIHKKNGGLSDARNAGIDIAQGEYITFVDSDDWIITNYIETLYKLVEKYQCKIGIGCYRAFHEEENFLPIQHGIIEKLFNCIEGIEKMFYQEMYDVAAWGKIYHHSLFATGIRYPFGLLFEDIPTTYRLFLKADNVAFTNHIIYNYLLRGNSIEGQPFNVKKLDSAVKILELMQSHSEELKPVEKAVRCRLLSFCMHILLEMPSNYPDKRKEKLIDYIKTNRWKVIKDSRARRKARIGAIISYLGVRATQKLFDRVKDRK